ncbi:MAG: DUF4190 domain-containing protein [Chloroflexota bacterium]
MYDSNYPQNMNYNMLPTSTMATVSLIAGILGFFILPVIASVVAIWTGYEARKETRSLPPRASGDGMATAGIVMGWIQIGLAVVSICCVIAYFGFFAALFASYGN